MCKRWYFISSSRLVCVNIIVPKKVLIKSPSRASHVLLSLPEEFPPQRTHVFLTFLSLPAFSLHPFTSSNLNHPCSFLLQRLTSLSYLPLYSFFSALCVCVCFTQQRVCVLAAERWLLWCVCVLQECGVVDADVGILGELLESE